jgi:DNA repair exonuclease SbcCD ATPase subunit
MDLKEYRRKLDHSLANYTYAVKILDNERTTLDKAQQQEKHTLEAQQVLQAIAEGVQQQAHQQIASVVTRCLEAVFQEDAYEFKIDFESKRGKTEARLLFVRDGNEIDPVDASGGGTVDVASMALRIACLVLSSPQNRRLLVLDEPWKYLSANYRPYLREIIQTLSKELSVQFVIVTHCPEFKMGKVIELE